MHTIHACHTPSLRVPCPLHICMAIFAAQGRIQLATHTQTPTQSTPNTPPAHPVHGRSIWQLLLILRRASSRPPGACCCTACACIAAAPVTGPVRTSPSTARGACVYRTARQATAFCVRLVLMTNGMPELCWQASAPVCELMCAAALPCSRCGEPRSILFWHLVIRLTHAHTRAYGNASRVDTKIPAQNATVVSSALMPKHTVGGLRPQRTHQLMRPPAQT
jgi:hypothetical protein